jgi:hypothetical protein
VEHVRPGYSKSDIDGVAGKFGQSLTHLCHYRLQKALKHHPNRTAFYGKLELLEDEALVRWFLFRTSLIVCQLLVASGNVLSQ